jgi:hypothetical protein
MDITLILKTNYQNSEWALVGEDYAGLEWLDQNTPKPTKATLEKQWPQVEYDTQVEAIQKQRQAAYQAEADPIFFESQRDPAVKVETWQAKVEEIKARYPYPAKPE